MYILYIYIYIYTLYIYIYNSCPVLFVAAIHNHGNKYVIECTLFIIVYILMYIYL